MTNELTERKSEVLKAMAEMEFYPAPAEKPTDAARYTKLPYSQIPSLGIGLNELSTAFQNVFHGGQSGLYRVTVPAGTHLAKFKDGRGYLGSALKDINNQGFKQSALNPVAFDPTMFMVAMALHNIDKKLDAIRETQQELLDFLIQKERSELRGDLNFLAEVLNNYKYNWNNEKYKTGNHLKALDVRQEAGRKIDFHREQISSKISKKSFFHSDQDVKKQLEKIQAEFKDYQLALYLFSFASFLEVLLLENFDSGYLSGIAGKIEEYALSYRELYTGCYNQLEGYAESSIQSGLLKGLAKANKLAGEGIAKVPVLGKTQIDETLIRTGDKLGEYGSKRVGQTMKQLIEKQSGSVLVFAEHINTINRLYNQPVTLLFDNENLYIEEGQVA